MTPDTPLDKNNIDSWQFNLLDEKAFELFFKENFKPLCGFCCYKFGFDVEQAKEAVHTSFIKLWEKRATLDPAQSVKTYLYRILTNNCLDIIRHQKVKQQHEHMLQANNCRKEGVHGYDSADFKELKSNIDHAVKEMPEQMRSVFVLAKYSGFTYAEIAHQLGVSVKTVETQMSRALVRLRIQLTRYLSTVIFLGFLLQ